METVKALPGKIQLIREDGEFLYPEAERFVEELKKSSNASSQYTVISIIGPQSSGKSYFLNTLFNANFDVLVASGGRKQTTKGIWMAKCAQPCMIIMDVEGCDGRERGEDDTLFERRSALFSLTVSDVLLLNMWFHDIGRQKGANLDLIKLIFEQRVKIEGQNKTTIIILVRDYDYETPSEITKKDLKTYMNKLWLQVHPSTEDRKMSDYIKVIVKDFPNKSHKEEFSQKCKDLAGLLCKFAESGDLEQKTGASQFAYSSKMIWDLICDNKKLSVADQKLAMSTHVCSETKDEILNSLNQETVYQSLISDTSMSVKEFNRELKLFLERIFSRYEEETKAYDENIRKKMMDTMQEEILHRFEPTFGDRIESLGAGLLSSLKSKAHDKLDNLCELEDSFIIDVTRPDMAEFDEIYNSRDVHPYFQNVLEKHRKKLEEDLTRIAKEEANKIQIERNQNKEKEIQIEQYRAKLEELQIVRNKLKEKELQIERQAKELQIERDQKKAKELQMQRDQENEKQLQILRNQLEVLQIELERLRTPSIGRTLINTCMSVSLTAVNVYNSIVELFD